MCQLRPRPPSQRRPLLEELYRLTDADGNGVWGFGVLTGSYTSPAEWVLYLGSPAGESAGILAVARAAATCASPHAPSPAATRSAHAGA